MDKAYLSSRWEDNKAVEEISVKGCKVTLHFLPESNGKTLDTVKKILTSSQYIDNITDKGDKAS